MSHLVFLSPPPLFLVLSNPSSSLGLSISVAIPKYLRLVVLLVCFEENRSVILHMLTSRDTCKIFIAQVRESQSLYFEDGNWLLQIPEGT